MDESRRREVYLRVARAAAYWQARRSWRARQPHTRNRLPATPNNALGALADFYGNMALVSTPDVGAGRKEHQQRCRQRALARATARYALRRKSIAEQVLQPPDPASLTQASNSKPANEEITSEQAAISSSDGSEHAEIAAPSKPADDGAAPALMPDGARAGG